jgi:hypothetical protein
MVFDKYYREERPIFVFPEQDIQIQMAFAHTEWTTVLYTLCLLRDIDEQVTMAMTPINRMVSRIEH